MKNLKKSVSLFLIFTILVLAFSSCKPIPNVSSSNASDTSGSSDADATLGDVSTTFSSSGATNNSTGTASIPANLPKYEIVWYTIDNPQNDLKAVFDEVSKYTLKKMNATVKCQIISWGDYNSKMPVLVAAGEKIDLAYTANETFSYLDYVRKGAFLPLDSLLKTYGQDIIAAMPKDFFDGVKVKDKIYAIPTIKEKSEAWYAYVYKDLVQKYGWNTSNVKSLYDLEPFMKDLKEKENGVIPLMVGSAFSPWLIVNPFERLTTFAGVYLDNHNNYKVENVYASPEYLQLIKKAREWKKAGYITSVTDSSTMGSALARQKDGFGAMIYAPNGEAFLENASSRPYVAFPITKKYITNNSVSGAMIAITKNSKDPARAMMFLNLLNSDTYLKRLVVHGIEGKHYVKTSENQIKLPEGKDVVNVGYNRAQFTLQNIFLNYLNPGDPANKKQLFVDYDKDSVTSKILGFQADSTKIIAYIAACNSVIPKYRATLELGEKDDYEAILAKLNSELKDAGIDKVIAEYQSQLNLWVQKSN